MRIYTIAKSTSGPIADILAGVNAGTILANINAGRARLIVIEEVPLAAA